jgi:hypothetical protein
MNTKQILLLILMASTAFSVFGYSRLTIERDWVIHANSGDDVDFLGALSLNDTSQRVLSIAVSPGLNTETNDSGIFVRYRGKMNGDTLLLNATATLDVNYDTSLASDPPLSGANRSFTPLTAPDANMTAQAGELAQQNSSLATVRDIVNWVHSTVQYDVSYWGKSVPATDVFRTRHGVCVEYTHLLISLARSLGFDTRYVSGYVYSNAWQPHAWAEIYIPGYGWLPADATFGEVGMMDGTHLAIAQGMDQASVYDVLISGNNASIEAHDHVTPIFLSNDSRNVSIYVHPDNYTYVVTVNITNNRPDYVFGSYQFLPDPSYAQQDSGIVLLQPHENLQRNYLINSSQFQDGYTYTLPLPAAFNDARDEKNLVVSKPLPGSQAQPQPCAPSVLLLLLPAALLPLFRGAHWPF